MSWNESPRSKLQGIAELKPLELAEIFGEGATASASGQRAFFDRIRAG